MEKTYTIKEVGKMFNLNASTLRYYEDQGLLTDVTKNESGQRVYEQKHIHRLSTLCCFKHAGMTINQLKTFFRLEKDQYENIDEILALLIEQRKILQGKLKELQADENHLQKKLAFYSDTSKALKEGKQLPLWKDYRDAK